jgi:hypothetical protein
MDFSEIHAIPIHIRSADVGHRKISLEKLN